MTTAVELRDVRFTYPGVLNRSRRFMATGRRRAPRPSNPPVLAGVSLSVEPGTCLGVIGRNGVGKSTLLKLLVGALRPDAGSIDVHGRVAAVIELGAGLHPDLSAEENAMLLGVAAGNRARTVRSRLDEILAFADLEDHREQHVRTFSSGMLARLAFSIATTFDPDVLLVDEVLGVGDASFSARARRRIDELMSGPTATILVSHDMASVSQMCQYVIWLEGGEIVAQGDSATVTSTYLEWAQVQSEEGDDKW